MDPFDTLGVEPVYELNRDELERRYRDLQRALHPDKHVDATAAVRRQSLSKAVDVNAAYKLLRDDVKRGEALLKRLGAEVGEHDQAGADPEFLMEVMELREQLAEARAAGNLDAVGKLGAAAEGKATRARERLTQQLRDAAAGDAGALEAASATLGRMRYYRRLRDEVVAIEEEALG